MNRQEQLYVIADPYAVDSAYLQRNDPCADQRVLATLSASSVLQVARALEETEYWADVRDVAKEALEECPDNEEAQDDFVWESVDGSSWVIYTARNLDVLRFTSNEDAWQEFGELSPENWLAQAAFAAMLADVREALHELRADTEEEEEDEE